MIIAIDGPSASGKGTLAKLLAQKLGFHYLDTGLLYRMVGLQAHLRNIALTDEEACRAIAKNLDVTKVSENELRGELVGLYASHVASLPAVRAQLLQVQRDFAQLPPGAVLDGRDIASVVCPDADIKFYVTASLEARAKRRAAETPDAILADIMADLAARDARDSNRQLAPLKAMPDAIILDTSALTIAQGLDFMLSQVTALTKNQV